MPYRLATPQCSCYYTPFRGFYQAFLCPFSKKFPLFLRPLPHRHVLPRTPCPAISSPRRVPHGKRQGDAHVSHTHLPHPLWQGLAIPQQRIQPVAASVMPLIPRGGEAFRARGWSPPRCSISATANTKSRWAPRSPPRARKRSQNYLPASSRIPR